MNSLVMFSLKGRSVDVSLGLGISITKWGGHRDHNPANPCQIGRYISRVSSCRENIRGLG